MRLPWFRAMSAEHPITRSPGNVFGVDVFKINFSCNYLRNNALRLNELPDWSGCTFAAGWGALEDTALDRAWSLWKNNKDGMFVYFNKHHETVDYALALILSGLLVGEEYTVPSNVILMLDC